MMRLSHTELERFTNWLRSCGAEIIAPTSEWELLRVKMKGETHVGYRNKAGSQTWPTPLAEAYKLRSCGHQPQLSSPVKQLRGNRKGSAMSPEVAPISAARERAHKRMMIMRAMKEAGYGWEDAFVRLRREGLIDCRSPSSRDGHRAAIRFIWFPNGARR